MIKKISKIIIFITVALFIVLACSGTKGLFKGKIANQHDRIHINSSGSNSGLWKTTELSVNYTYSSSSDHFNLTGFISISEHITNTYSTIMKLYVRVSFLDKNGRVISTNNTNPLYSVGSTTPRKIKFNSNLSLPVEADAFCFSYFGEFIGVSDMKSESQYIVKFPFQ
jgi:hypothetical protein